MLPDSEEMETTAELLRPYRFGGKATLDTGLSAEELDADDYNAEWDEAKRLRFVVLKLLGCEFNAARKVMAMNKVSFTRAG